LSFFFFRVTLGEALKIVVYILNRVPSKTVNKIFYELWTNKKSSIKHLHIWGFLAEARPYRPHERKLDSRTISCYFVGHVERSWGYTFYNLTSRSFFDTGNVRFLKEVEFEKEENIRNVVFEEVPIINNHASLVPIIVQNTISVIENNVQTIVDDIVPEQDNNEVLPQIPIKQPQQPQEVSLSRSIRERGEVQYQMITLSFSKNSRMALV